MPKPTRKTLTDRLCDGDDEHIRLKKELKQRRDELGNIRKKASRLSGAVTRAKKRHQEAVEARRVFRNGRKKQREYLERRIDDIIKMMKARRQMLYLKGVEMVRRGLVEEYAKKSENS